LTVRDWWQSAIEAVPVGCIVTAFCENRIGQECCIDVLKTFLWIVRIYVMKACITWLRSP
jgi:hypothetical protein